MDHKNNYTLKKMTAFLTQLENSKIDFSEDVKKNKGKKIAIIGGGPSGLTCTAFLAKRGFSVDIYEKYSKLGGLLRHGIPEFRVDRKELDDTITNIINLGDVHVFTNQELEKDIFLKDLQKNYNAVVLTFGANISKHMNIPGENLKGVFGANELIEKNLHPNYENKNVIVIGGGDVAIDASRIIKRKGAKNVTVVYRRTEALMPANRIEIKDAKEDGVEFLFQTNIIKINSNNNELVNNVECLKTDLIQKEGEKREIPINIEGSNHLINTDYVIMAVGSKPEKELVDKLGLDLTEKGYIKIDENNATSLKNVFAGGDLAGHTSSISWAARTGKDIADSIATLI